MQNNDLALAVICYIGLIILIWSLARDAKIPLRYQALYSILWPVFFFLALLDFLSDAIRGRL